MLEPTTIVSIVTNLLFRRLLVFVPFSCVYVRMYILKLSESHKYQLEHRTVFVEEKLSCIKTIFSCMTCHTWQVRGIL